MRRLFFSCISKLCLGFSLLKVLLSLALLSHMVSVFELQIALATKNFKTLKNLIIYYGSFTLLNLFFSSQKNLLEVQISARETKKPLKIFLVCH